MVPSVRTPSTSKRMTLILRARAEASERLVVVIQGQLYEVEAGGSKECGRVAAMGK
jgi:hypothetical protein